MQLLRKASQYTKDWEDLNIIYYSYIRSLLEQSCVVQGSSLTKENINDLERIQKNAMRIILQEKYEFYENSLEDLQIEKLRNRREMLLYRFGNKSTKQEEMKYLFPLNNKKHTMNTRKQNKFKIQKANTKRMTCSAIPKV